MSLVKLATLISSITALLLLIIKLFTWIISWSIAVLSSAIDSLLDLAVSIFNYFAVKNAEKDTDSEFNYGRWKIEALASLFEWIIITLSWIYIFYASIIKLIDNEKISYLLPSIIVMSISVIITFLLVYFLEYVWKKTNNLVIKADSLHYKTDLYSNAWILLSLWIISYTWFYYIDGIVWIIISIYIIYSSYKLIKNGFLLLLDVSLPKKEVKKIIKIIKKEKIVNDYHFLRTRESWKFKFVDVHLVFNPTIKLINAHNVSDKIEEKIKKIDNTKIWIFNLHLDPYDDSNQNKDKCNVFFNKT